MLEDLPIVGYQTLQQITLLGSGQGNGSLTSLVMTNQKHSLVMTNYDNPRVRRLNSFSIRYILANGNPTTLK